MEIKIIHNTKEFHRTYSMSTTYLNPIFAATHFLSEILSSPSSATDWVSITSPAIRPFLRHAACDSHYISTTLCITSAIPPLLPPFENFTKHPAPDYIVLSFQDYDPWYGLSEAIYLGHFKRSSEKWNFYYFPREQPPDLTQFPSLKGIILTGGKYNISDDSLPWKVLLLQQLRRVYEETSVKIVGICLGHQAVALALGGTIQRNADFIYEVANCAPIRPSFISAFKSAKIHSEHVSAPPPFFETTHSSSSFTHEVCYVLNRILTFQSHPEFSSSFISEFHLEMMLKKGKFPESCVPSLRSHFSGTPTDTEYVILKINEFLRSSSL